MNNLTKRHVAYYQVSKDEIPFHCPPKSEEKWSSHPKVFLDLTKNNKANCPYCGAYYVLREDD